MPEKILLQQRKQLLRRGDRDSILKTRIANIWNSLRSSYWFIPVLLQVAAFVLAWVTLSLDAGGLPKPISEFSWIYDADAGGARSVLSTIAGSMITAASVTFSITIVALTMTSSQFGPRLLRNFMRDPVNQVVLGTFIATFLYSLLILRTVSGTEDAHFIPYLSISVAFIMAFGSALILIYFIHHISTSISASDVIASVSCELEQRIEKVFPEPYDADSKQPNATDLAEKCRSKGQEVLSDKTGYLRAVNYEGLLLLTSKNDGFINLNVRAGDFLVKGAPIGQILLDKAARPEFLKQLLSCLIIGETRTAEQDIEFSIHQLVEVAVRALSPGINDPYTALVCLDRLGSALHSILGRNPLPEYHCDESGTARLKVSAVSRRGCINASFNKIRQCTREVPSVAFRMLEVIEVVARQADTREVAQALQRHVDGVYNACRPTLVDAGDVTDLEERYRSASEALKSKVSEVQ